jgi:hypothetical protein
MSVETNNKGPLSGFLGRGRFVLIYLKIMHVYVDGGDEFFSETSGRLTVNRVPEPGVL